MGGSDPEEFVALTCPSHASCQRKRVISMYLMLSALLQSDKYLFRFKLTAQVSLQLLVSC